jgi:hypothetical protein
MPPWNKGAVTCAARPQVCSALRARVTGLPAAVALNGAGVAAAAFAAAPAALALEANATARVAP